MMMTTNLTIGDVLYRNRLAGPEDLSEFVREGQPVMSFPQGMLRLENGLSADQGQQANYLLWCPRKFPADLAISFEFQPLREPGLAMLWFCADGRDGKDLFDPSLAPRRGEYRHYHSGDINGYHASFFRRKNPKGERDFHTCNLRKSHGFHLVCRGADPLPDVHDATRRYRIQVVKCGGRIRFSIDDLLIYDWLDDGVQYGPVLGEGYIGFRQMAPLVAEYANLEVRTACGAPE
jgi:hypothetical protein